MKIFMIGGTGLIGSISAKELIEKGHYVTSLALPPIPKSAFIPNDMNLVLKDFNKMTDEDLLNLMKDCKIFIFAAGIDERIEGKAPIYDKYYKYNIAPIKRLLPLAKESGIKHSVILGSYFVYFNEIWSDLDLYNKHPYIRSRVDQEEIALSYGDDNMTVSVVQLPYIFGVQKGRKPVWVFLVEQILKMKFATFYPRGGSAMITANQAGKLVANVALKPLNSKAIPVGFYNLTWNEMLAVFHEEMGIKRRVKNIPKWIYNLGMKSMIRKQKKKGIDPGLDLRFLGDVMYRNAYIEKTFIEEYDVPNDDIQKAIKESVQLSLKVIDDDFDIVGMKGE